MGAGQWIQQITLGWLVYDLTESYFLLGVVGGMRALPMLFVGPLAGVAADRMDRRLLLMIVESFLGVWAALFAFLVAFGDVQVWQIIVFTLVSGAVWSFSGPIRKALVPNVVPRSELLNAIALESAGHNATRIVGPALGGVLIATLGPGVNFFLQSALYFFGFSFVTRLRLPP
ncbi:MAG: MFS transporter, partial [Dehalococcoidia bacterium]